MVRTFESVLQFVRCNQIIIIINPMVWVGLDPRVSHIKDESVDHYRNTTQHMGWAEVNLSSFHGNSPFRQLL